MAIGGDAGTWTVGTNWPWPQMVITDHYVLGFAINGSDLNVYELINSAGTWTATMVGRLGYSSRVTAVDVASFGQTYFITTVGTYSSQRVCRIFYRNQMETPDSDTVIEISSGLVPAGTTCCNFKGQLIVGGLQSNDYKWKDLGPCSVAWSGINHGEFDPAVTPDAGFMKMPWDRNKEGLVYKVRSLGDKIRVYGDRGIAELTPFSHDKVVGFGRKLVDMTGIISYGAMDGDELIHGYIDRNYDFWTDVEGNRTNHGYRKHLVNLTGTVRVSYDATDKKFYLSNGTVCYVFNGFGMYTTHQCMTSAGNYNGIRCGFIKDNSSSAYAFETTGFTTNSIGVKSIEAIETDMMSEQAISMGLKAQYDYASSFVTGPSQLINKNGSYTHPVSGRAFKVYMSGTYDATKPLSMSQMIAKLKYIDKRTLRGRLNVNQGYVE